MCNKHYTTSVKTRFTFVFYTDSYIRGINHIFFLLFLDSFLIRTTNYGWLKQRDRKSVV